MWTAWVFWDFFFMNSELSMSVTFRYIWYQSFSQFFHPFRPDRDTFTHITSGNVPRWSNPQESILRSMLQAVRHYKTRFHYFVHVHRYLWLIYDLDFYSPSEFRSQGKILNSLVFCLTKVFCACVWSGQTTFFSEKRLFHAPRDRYMGGSTTH